MTFTPKSQANVPSTRRSASPLRCVTAAVALAIVSASSAHAAGTEVAPPTAPPTTVPATTTPTTATPRVVSAPTTAAPVTVPTTAVETSPVPASTASNATSAPAAVAPIAAPTPPASASTTKAGAALPTAASLYASGKIAIEAKDWARAIADFEAAAKLAGDNADVRNLLGYSYRKSGNYPKAFENYAVALRLNPNHRGALEYQGEAFVETGKLNKAKANLRRLKKVCGVSCDEYRDLAAAIRGTGGRYRAKAS